MPGRGTIKFSQSRKDPRYQGYKDIDDIPDHILDEIAHMFEVYKELERGEKAVEILGWYGKEEEKFYNRGTENLQREI